MPWLVRRLSVIPMYRGLKMYNSDNKIADQSQCPQLVFYSQRIISGTNHVDGLLETVSASEEHPLSALGSGTGLDKMDKHCILEPDPPK
jgi:hypothetical protein